MKGKLAGIKVAILACDGFEEVELTEPRAALEKAGAITHLISPKQNKITAVKHGHWTNKYKVDVKLEKANPKNYDAVLLPGGVINPDQLRTEKKAIDFLKAFFRSKKPIAAICHGPLTLIETKKIKGKKMTSYHSVQTDMKNAGVKWQNKKVVIDGLLVTSRQPSDIPAFNKAIINVFAKNKDKKKVRAA